MGVSWEGNSCKLSYHLQWTDSRNSMYAGAIYGDDFSFGLREVKAITVNSGNSEVGRGVGYRRETTSPSIFAVALQGPSVTARAMGFTFVDAAMAGRVAKAIAYAVEACGGSAPVQTGVGVTLPQAGLSGWPSF
jgi:hypothetical protein